MYTLAILLITLRMESILINNKHNSYKLLIYNC